MASKSTRNLFILLLVVLVVLVVLVLVVFLVGFIRSDTNGSPSREVSAPASEKQIKESSPTPVEETRTEPTHEEKTESPKHVSKMEEDAFAVAVEGEPLVVILPWYEEIGKISVEKYDREGNATGKPLESGTMVQIPDPFKPGERIRFVVP